MDTHDWCAWYNRMPGANDSKLHVAGICSLSSSNIQVKLVPGNEGVRDDPDLVVLDLWVHVPEIGDTQFVEREVTWSGDVGPNVKRVAIRGGDSGQIDVLDVTQATAVAGVRNAETEAKEANQYVFEGDGIEGSLETTSASGRALGSVSVDGHRAQRVKFTGDQLGLSLRGDLDFAYDAYSRSVVVVVPPVNLRDDTEAFDGFAVIVTTHTSIGGPRLVNGPLKTYDVRKISGKASRVESLTTV